ncbi:hypothetical protein G6F46_010843 [Rhizopus delemar]|uniref:Intradiol ring-cleavage dioxygenases domain-containing protein n=3 Tax=Rhizopus TaxID=4842 RepID=I1CAB4_RHIO9|nr:hypothetical protein RO3G_10104 [Rhizopus delemar RA 99-880]KAG1465389.1 hypothetical protein G6F55_001171 [Rhizopus delemar]KAG1536272.1 hypothetical protein G6F51_011061 [Rhizopus arrhizus]KAG1493470.1 hypothetical protein G6F53_012750 [Rhizopus delemar]KAG1504829.1 hypothetical protein G6F54_000741 [Rhizopus delemar]|eukprot:EIE85394.1 hypothetical protein RO3G_10104 [Rhizopus delemar RA 99-880]
MKFSVAAISAIVLATVVPLNAADSYSDAMKTWCDGLGVSFPTGETIVVAGEETKVTVTRKPDERKKTITGLDLFSVDSDGNAKYIQNIWAGSYDLQTTASLKDTIPNSVSAGLYYYRVWVTNLVKDPNGDKDTHGPDCIETSHTFKVTSGSHTNAAGDTEYTESIDDDNIYHPEHYKGCFGLSVDYPKKGSTFNVGHHIHIQALRDSASQTDSLIKVELFEGDKFRGVAWTGNEPIQNSFTLKDHLKLENINPEADYRYKLYVTSKHSNEICTFQSKTFHIQD